MTKGGGFFDEYDDLLKQSGQLSDADLERLLMGNPRAERAGGVESLEPGSRVAGIVVDVRGGEVLVEIDGKTLGVIDAAEFGNDPLPRIGEPISAHFERFDRRADTAILSVSGLQREVLWEHLRSGSQVEGTVVAVNKGGLTVDLKGLRAFLPISQIERGRVEDASAYVGRKLRCEVTDVNRAERNVILSRRVILEREAANEKVSALARLTEGESLKGTVVRLTEHGAFIDLGGIDGLLPQRKLQALLQARVLPGPMTPGQEVQVLVTRVDKEMGRVSLDIQQLESESWSRVVEGFQPGDEVTGWVSAIGAEEVKVSIDEGVFGTLPTSRLGELGEGVRTGSIVKAVVAAVDRDRRRILLRPRERP